MPGKYSHLKGQLTKFTNELDYQDRVNDEKNKIREFLSSRGRSCSAANFGEVLIESRREKDRLEELEKEQNLRIEALNQILVELLEGEDYTSLKMTNGVSLTIKDDVYANVENKEIFYNWIEEQGLDDLFSVNYQTMASMVKTKLIDGLPIPPGIKTYFKQSITVRGAKNVKE